MSVTKKAPTVNIGKSMSCDPNVHKTILDVTRSAAIQCENELEALDVLNRAKVIASTAELFQIDSYELWYYIENGEEEAERCFDLDRPVGTPRVKQD